MRPVLFGVALGVLVTILCRALFFNMPENMPIANPGGLAVIAGLLAGVGGWFALSLFLEERERKRDPEGFAIKQAATAENLALYQKKRQEKQQGKWDSVPKVVCPHCQEVGKVEKFVPPPPEDLLKAGIMYHLSLIETSDESKGKIREANRKGEIPNMRCSNCTVVWRV